MPVQVPAQPDPADGDRRRNAERTRAEILDVATAEFARLGYAGARVDEIAALTSTTKRMIYYYFGGKEQLYAAVRERALATLRPAPPMPRPAPATESSLAETVDPETGSGPDPVALVLAIADQTFRRYQAHPDLIRLLVLDDLHETPATTEPTPSPAAGRDADLRDLLGRELAGGIDRGLIRPGVRAVDVFQIIDGFCTYRVISRTGFRQFAGRDLLDPAGVDDQRRLLGDVLTRYLTG